MSTDDDVLDGGPYKKSMKLGRLWVFSEPLADTAPCICLEIHQSMGDRREQMIATLTEVSKWASSCYSVISL